MGRGNVLRHDCDIPDRGGSLGLILGGSLWRCPECRQVYVFAQTSDYWCDWVPGTWWSDLRAKIGGI